jgi:hypothetical protein
MKLIKYYAWESFFMGEVSELRKKELAIQRKVDFIKTCQISVGAPGTSQMVAFLLGT